MQRVELCLNFIYFKKGFEVHLFYIYIIWPLSFIEKVIRYFYYITCIYVNDLHLKGIKKKNITCLDRLVGQALGSPTRRVIRVRSGRPVGSKLRSNLILVITLGWGWARHVTGRSGPTHRVKIMGNLSARLTWSIFLSFYYYYFLFFLWSKQHLNVSKQSHM